MARILAAILFLSNSVWANVIGTDAQNFNTITNGLDFVTVHSSETLDPGVINVGFFGSYSRNTFSYLGNKNAQGGQATDSMTTTDFNLGVGVGPHWDFGLSFPYLVSVDENSANQDRAILKDSGLTEIRLNSKYRFWGNDRRGWAFVFTVNNNLIANNPYSGEGAGPTLNFEIAGDRMFGKKLAAGGNFGYRLRQRGRKIPEFEIEPRGDQVIASGALSYLVHKADTKVITEVFGSWPPSNRDLNTDRSQLTFEWLFGLKHDVNRNIAIHAGGGTKLANGVASPDWRVYAGLNWDFGPLWGEPKPYLRRINPKFRWDAPEEGADVEYQWQAPKAEERFVADEILFGFGSDRVINEGGRDALAQLATHIKRPPAYRVVVVEGHTDSVGSAKYNKELSQRRADNIRKYLVEEGGLDPKKVRAVGLGESQPIADNGNFQGRQKNRRVEFRVYRQGSVIPEEYRPGVD